MGVKDTANLAMIPAAYAEDKVYSVLPSDGDGDFTFTRTGSGTRINKGGYIETMGNNVPRLNYRLDADGNVSECAELLLEESRINSTTYSENFTQTSYWSNVIDVVATTNQGIAPDGTNNANKIQANSGTNFKILRTSAFTIPSGITMSIFVKRGSHDFIIFKAQGDYAFNLKTLNWGGNYSNVGYQVYPNDWVRLYATTTSSVLSYFGIYLTDGSFNQSWNATGNEFVYVWGAQYETGSTLSSYIVSNNGSATTRNKDEAEINNFADAPTDYPFTMYVQMRIETGIKGFGIAFGWDATSDRYYSIGYSEASSNKKFRFTNRSQGTGYDFEPSVEYYEGLHKVAVKFISSTNFKGYINGIEVANHTHTASSFNSSIQDLLLGQLREVSDTNSRNPIKEAFMWNKALTDAEMVDVTSYDTFEEMATGQQFTIQ